MIAIFTGNGKGKTTAALGQMVRVSGRGKHVLMIQFIKGPWESGEHVFNGAFNIPPENFKIHRTGKGFVGILGDKLPREEHEKAAREALELFKMESARGLWDLMVLDEVNVAVSLGLLTTGEVVAAVKDFPEEKLLLLTGRDAPPEFIELADLVTEMKEVKHPFQGGKIGKLGVEF